MTLALRTRFAAASILALAAAGCDSDPAGSGGGGEGGQGGSSASTTSSTSSGPSSTTGQGGGASTATTGVGGAGVGGAGGAGGSPPVLLALGEACTEANECASDHCASGVCCTTDCDAGCESCLAVATGGADGTCAPVTSEIVCRAAAGACDVEETCDGVTPDCPTDDLENQGTSCRAAAGMCDVEETCDGASPDCPMDVLATTECRASASPCDAAEVCSGSAVDCPADLPVVCNDAGDVCIEGACDPGRRVFVTSTLHDGNLGGAAGAHAICQARAMSAGLSGTFEAWIGTAASSPATSFVQSNIPYVMVDGTKVADSYADLVDGLLDAPIRVTELGTTVLNQGGFGEDRVWTGANDNGNANPTRCNDWTTNDLGVNGAVGYSHEADFWSIWLIRPCNESFRLFCFEQ
jgi:hypothetical protein